MSAPVPHPLSAALPSWLCAAAVRLADHECLPGESAAETAAAEDTGARVAARATAFLADRERHLRDPDFVERYALAVLGRDLYATGLLQPAIDQGRRLPFPPGADDWIDLWLLHALHHSSPLMVKTTYDEEGRTWLGVHLRDESHGTFPWQDHGRDRNDARRRLAIAVAEHVQYQLERPPHEDPYPWLAWNLEQLVPLLLLVDRGRERGQLQRLLVVSEVLERGQAAAG